MSKSAKTIIKYFCDRFLEIDYYPNSIKAILDLKLDKLKKIKKEELKALKKKKIKKIRDFSDLSLEDYKELASEIEIDLETLNNIYIASNLISNAWNKRKVYLKKAQMKVVIAGLDYAGKTSLINRLIHNKNYYDLVNLKPTVGANVEEFQSDKLNMVIWDLGGQKGHIEEYLDDPEKYFIQVDLLIFVIDSQDDVRYDDAIKYLEDILNILKYLDEIPFILVLLNKADSDLIEDPDFQIKLEYLKDKISQKIKEHKINFNFDIVPTSIFNVYANEPEIAKSIKSIFSKPTEKVEDQKIPEIDKKVQKILDINLQFMDKVYSEIDEIKRILIRISPARISKNLFQVPFQSVESKKADEEREEKGKKSKQSKLPEPLKFIQKTEKKATEMKEAELKKLPQDKSGEIPPKIPSKKIEPRDLNPPPSPPKNTPEGKGVPIRPPPKHDRSKNIQRGNIRVNMLSELKELFVKRGIASEQISIQRPGEIKRTENSDMKKSDLERKKNKSHPDNEQHTNNISD
jgi:small GTP-binding protein